MALKVNEGGNEMVNRMFEEIPKGKKKPGKFVTRCKNCGKKLDDVNGNRYYCDRCRNR